MEIIKGKGRLKETTVEDVVHADRKKNQFFMSGSDRSPSTPELKAAAEAMLNSGADVLEANQNKRQLYNANLTNLDPDYAGLRPLQSFIVRLEIRGEMKTKSGLWLPSANKLKGKTRGTNFDKDDIQDPYEFTSVAVLVAAPAFETELKAGDLVQVVKPNILVSGEDVMGFEYNYAHPDYKMPLVPTDPEDKHFGYAIIPRGHIKVILERQSVEQPEREA